MLTACRPPESLPIVFLDRAAIFLGRGAFIAQAQIRASTLLLHLPAQLQFELAQRFDDICFEQCSSCSIAFHRSIGELLQLLDHFVEPAGAQSGCAPLASQILRFTQSLANLGRQLTVIAPAAAHWSTDDRHRYVLCRPSDWLPFCVPPACCPHLAVVLVAATLLTLLSLSLLTLLTLLSLPLLSLLSLLTLLSLLSLLSLLPLLLPLPLLSLLLSVSSRSVLIQTPAQRIEIVSKLSRAIEILFRTRTIRATRTLFRRLQAFGKIVQTAFDRAFIRSTAATLLTVLLLTAIQRLFAFANAIRNAIARKRVGRFFQLPRRTLLTLTAAAHRARRLFDVLLQIVNACRPACLFFPPTARAFCFEFSSCAF